MRTRYLLGAGIALAAAFGSAEGNAQTWSMWGWQYPVAFYVGPEGGWTQLNNQRNENITTPAFTVNGAGPFNSFTAVNRYDSGFNAGMRAGVQWGPIRVEEEYSYRHNGLSEF